MKSHQVAMRFNEEEFQKLDTIYQRALKRSLGYIDKVPYCFRRFAGPFGGPWIITELLLSDSQFPSQARATKVCAALLIEKLTVLGQTIGGPAWHGAVATSSSGVTLMS